MRGEFGHPARLAGIAICGLSLIQLKMVFDGTDGRDAIGCEERLLAGLAWAARRRGRRKICPLTSAPVSTANRGLFHLRRKGYVVVARRWSSGDLRVWT